MPPSLGEVTSPSIEPVAPQEKPVRARMASQSGLDRSGQRRHILRVVEDGEPLPMLMRGHAIQTLQHLVSHDGNAALRSEGIRKDRAPHRMGVQDRPGAAHTD